MNKVFIIEFLIFCIVSYNVYRHSTLFQKIRFKDKRYFIKSDLDKLSYSHRLIYGIIFLITGIIFYFFKDSFLLSELLITIIPVLLIMYGFADIFSSVFLKPNPVIEILIKAHQIRLLKGGKYSKELYGCDDFQISIDQIFIKKDNELIQLKNLELTTNQINDLQNDLTQIEL